MNNKDGENATRLYFTRIWRRGINARCDNIIQLDTCGENCYELMIRMLKIVEDAYPSFMKALWA